MTLLKVAISYRNDIQVSTPSRHCALLCGFLHILRTYLACAFKDLSGLPKLRISLDKELSIEYPWEEIERTKSAKGSLQNLLFKFQSKLFIKVTYFRQKLYHPMGNNAGMLVTVFILNTDLKDAIFCNYQ